MRNPISLAALLAGAVLSCGSDWVNLHVVEQAVETDILSISIPDDTTGSMAVTACSGCKPLLLQLTPRSQYFIGNANVKFTELQSLARSGKSRNLNVLYDAKSRTITRLIASGPRPIPPAQQRPAK